MQRLVKGATKPKVAAPKAKYIEPLLDATYSRGNDFEVAMEALSRTLAKSQQWTVAYKALIVFHIMIREGSQDVVLRYLSRNPRVLEVDDDMGRQAVGLSRYARYLGVRAAQFKETKTDYVRAKNKQGKSRLAGLTIDKGLLRECESVIIQIDALVKCHFDERDVDNDVTLMAFRLLVHDLLSLFQVLNEGVINLLESFFELSRYDAENALEVYKGFTRLTSKVIAFLKVAKNLEYQTKLRVPNIKHAPTSLVSSLEVYLNDPDFDINRRQYLAEKQAHKSSKAEIRAQDSKREPAQQVLQLQQQQKQQSQAAGGQSQFAGAQPPAQQPQQAQQVPQPAAQQVQPLQIPATGDGYARPQQFDLLTGDVTSINPFYQVQAAQIQLEQDQAQLQLQQLQQQEIQRQQSMAQQQELQRQQSMAQQQEIQRQQSMVQQPSFLQQQPTANQPFVPQITGQQFASQGTGQPFAPQLTGQAPFSYQNQPTGDQSFANFQQPYQLDQQQPQPLQASFTGQNAAQSQHTQLMEQNTGFGGVAAQHTGGHLSMNTTGSYGGFNFGQTPPTPVSMGQNNGFAGQNTGVNPFKRLSSQSAGSGSHPATNPFTRHHTVQVPQHQQYGQNISTINPVNSGMNGFNFGHISQQPTGTKNPFRSSMQ